MKFKKTGKFIYNNILNEIPLSGVSEDRVYADLTTTSWSFNIQKYYINK